MKLIKRYKKFKDLKVGDIITIESFENIKRTLDENNKFDGTLFANEMVKMCNKEYKIRDLNRYQNERIHLTSTDEYGADWVFRIPWIKNLTT